MDPGGDLERLAEAVEENGVDIEKIILTHPHIDHAGAAADAMDMFQTYIEGPSKEDLFWIEGLPMQAQMFGTKTPRTFMPSRWLVDGDTVTVGNEELEVLHCPGHTPGHVVFFNRASKLALVGDVLFQGSIGRSDFPQGDHDTLIRSIKEKLLPLGEDVQFIPGHGPMSTMGAEQMHNPFLQ